MKKISKVASSIFDVIENFDANTHLTVDGFIKDDNYGILINTPVKKPLYAIKLSTAANINKHLSKKSIDTIHKKFKKHKDAFIHWALIKNDKFQRNLIFSHNKQILEIIAKEFQVDFVPADELLNILYDLQLNNDYSIDKTKLILKPKITMNTDPSYEYVGSKYNKIMKSTVFENFSKLNVYQAVTYKPQKKTNISELFQTDFKGVVWTYISFNMYTASNLAKTQASQAKTALSKDEEDFLIVEDAVKHSNEDMITMNTTLIIDKEKDSPLIHSNIGDCLNVQFSKHPDKMKIRRNLIKYSPLIERNILWNAFRSKEFLYDYIASVHKLDSPEPNICGTDINQAFVNFNFNFTTFDRKNTKPHFFIGGETGSTKTTFLNAALTQTIGYDFHTKKLDKSKLVKIRGFDIKKSMLHTAKEVQKHHPEIVSIAYADLNSFSYNILDIDVKDDGSLDQSSLSFCKKTISMLLCSKDKENPVAGLTFEEEALFGKLITEIYNNNTQENFTIEEIALYQEDLAKELYSIGYREYDYLNDIKEEKYSFLKKPTLSSLVTLLEKEVDRAKNNRLDKEISESLHRKIATIASLGYDEKENARVPGYFNRYAQFNIDTAKQWLLFDMNEIYTKDEYAAIQWIYLNKIVESDKKEQLRRREAGLPEYIILYPFEECHNLFLNRMFMAKRDSNGDIVERGILDSAALEWRSYGLILVPVTQKPTHVPSDVFSSLGTKFFLFPEISEDGSGIDAQVDEIDKIMKLNSNVLEFMKETPRFHACTITEHGSFMFKIETDQYTRDIIDGKVKKPETESKEKKDES